MSMQVKPGYTNPLMMMKEQKKGFGPAQRMGNGQKGMKDQVKELQMKQQKLQSEMLLLKATGTNGNENSTKKLEKMETKLDEVTDDLRIAKKDMYVKEEDKESTGLYQVREKNGKRVVEVDK